MYRLVALLTLGIAGAGLADTVVLKNGSRMQGEVVEDSPKQVVLKTRNGRVTLPRRLVKEVIEEAAPEPAPEAPPPAPVVPKPRPSAPAAPVADEAPFGGTRKDNFWARIQDRVQDGDRFEFTLRYHTLPLEVRRELDVRRAAGGFKPVWKGETVELEPAPYATKLTTTVWGIGLEAQGHEGFRSTGEGYDEHESQEFRGDRFGRLQGPEDTLTVSGRSFPCRIQSETLKSGIETRTWCHVDDTGHYALPRVLKREWNGVVVQELTAVRPTDEPEHYAPRDPGVRVGDRVTWREKAGPGADELVERTYVVEAVCPNQVRTRTTEGRRYSGWLYNRNNTREIYRRYVKHEETTLQLGGDDYLVMFHEGGVQRQWYRMWPDGRGRFPGLVRGELNGVPYRILVKIERVPRD
ncbi:MAG: hypothetical protein R3F62_25570 [Planctomycetota bacterium]